jgi:hypothetical protein
MIKSLVMVMIRYCKEIQRMTKLMEENVMTLDRWDEDDILSGEDGDDILYGVIGNMVS